MCDLRRLVPITRSGMDGPHIPVRRKCFLIGRNPKCDVRIQLPWVGPEQCTIESCRDETFLTHLNPSTPTLLNGWCLLINRPVKLYDGDVIKILDRGFRYETGESFHRPQNAFKRWKRYIKDIFKSRKFAPWDTPSSSSEESGSSSDSEQDNRQSMKSRHSECLMKRFPEAVREHLPTNSLVKAFHTCCRVGPALPSIQQNNTLELEVKGKKITTSKNDVDLDFQLFLELEDHGKTQVDGLIICIIKAKYFWIFRTLMYFNFGPLTGRSLEEWECHNDLTLKKIPDNAPPGLWPPGRRWIVTNVGDSGPTRPEVCWLVGLNVELCYVRSDLTSHCLPSFNLLVPKEANVLPRPRRTTSWDLNGYLVAVDKPQARMSVQGQGLTLHQCFRSNYPGLRSGF